MVDIEAVVFDACARAILEKYPDAFTTSEYVAAPASFPAVSVMEVDNYTDTDRIDTSRYENASVVAYDVRIFSNLRSGAKKQAKDIAQIVDGIMNSLNFTRTFTSRDNDPTNSAVFTVISHYVASVSHDGIISRR